MLLSLVQVGLQWVVLDKTIHAVDLALFRADFAVEGRHLLAEFFAGADIADVLGLHAGVGEAFPVGRRGYSAGGSCFQRCAR